MARKPAPPHQRIMESGLAPIPAVPDSGADDFMRNMIRYHDQANAARIIADYYLQVWASQHGAELEALKHQIEEVDSRYRTSAELMERLKERRSKTQPYIRSEVWAPAKPIAEEGRHEH